MIYRIEFNTPYHFYKYMNVKSLYIDRVRRITTIREINQFLFNYNQFFNNF